MKHITAVLTALLVLVSAGMVGATHFDHFTGEILTHDHHVVTSVTGGGGHPAQRNCETEIPHGMMGSPSCYNGHENVVAWATNQENGCFMLNPVYDRCVSDWGWHPLNLGRDFVSPYSYWNSWTPRFDIRPTETMFSKQTAARRASTALGPMYWKE